MWWMCDLGECLPLFRPQCLHLYNGWEGLYSLVSEVLPFRQGMQLRRDPTPTLPALPILPRALARARLAQQKGSPTASSAPGWPRVSMCVVCVCAHMCNVTPS